MTKSNSTTIVQTKKMVNCLDCALGRLHQYGKDPILAACEAHPQPNNERFPFEIMVASFLRICKEHKHTNEVKEIEHRKKAA